MSAVVSAAAGAAAGAAALTTALTTMELDADAADAVALKNDARDLFSAAVALGEDELDAEPLAVPPALGELELDDELVGVALNV